VHPAKIKDQALLWATGFNHGEDALEKATAMIALRAEQLRQNAQLV
jgi:hypothetical protein